MCVRVGAITPSDRVVLIDDLIATGGATRSLQPLQPLQPWQGGPLPAGTAREDKAVASGRERENLDESS